MNKRTLIELDGFEEIALTNADWAMFEANGNFVVGEQFVDFVTQTGLSEDPYADFRQIVKMVNAVLGDSEVDDTEVREAIIGRLEDLAHGKFPIKTVGK